MNLYLLVVLSAMCLVLGSQGMPMNARVAERNRRAVDTENVNPDTSTEDNVDDSRVEPAEEAASDGAFQSDIMLTDEQWAALQKMLSDDDDEEEENEDGDGDESGEHGSRRKRKAITFPQRRWPQKTVPYEISSSSLGDTAAILQGMQQWTDNTCLRFQPYVQGQANGPLAHDSRITFIKDSGGCWSYLGRVSAGAQPISIGPGCGQAGTVAHEIGHAIGFHHEQSRPDRDNYVNIHYENIQEGFENNFAKYSTYQVTTREVPYDVGSLMHYGTHYFSKNTLPTITTKDPSKLGLLGNRDSLTFYDIKLANIIYDCNQDCTAEIVCLNDGYQGPNCDCVCPPGYSGAFCQTGSGGSGGVGPEEPSGTCEHIFTDQSGDVTSVNYPNNYADLFDCTYRIRGGPGSTITLIFRDFDLEDHATCGYDYLNVLAAGQTGTGNTYCGDQLPPAHFVSSNEVVLTFHSDPYVNGRGFRLTYFINGPLVGEVTTTTEVPTTTMTTTTTAPPTTTVTTTTTTTDSGNGGGDFVGTCGGYFGALSGTMASPNYPAPYTNSQSCFYTIQVPTGRRVELTFHQLDIEQSVQCSKDYVSIDIGDGIEVPMKLCGSTTPSGTFVSLQNRMMLRLRADSTITRSGFAASYRTIDI